MLSIFALSLAVFFQLGAALIALRAVFYAKQKIIWITSSTALLLIAFQRVTSLIHIISLNRIQNAEMFSAFIDLLISMFLVMLVAYAVPTFLDSELTEKIQPQNLSNLEIAEEITNVISEHHAAESKIQQQIKNLTALREIDMAITRNTDIRIISNVILKNALNRLDADAAIIFQLNPDAGILEHVADRGFSNYLDKSSIPFGESIAGRVAWTREMLQLENIDISDITPGFAKLLNSEPFEDYYCTPLIAKGQVKGVLEIFNRTKINPSDDWLSFFEALGGQTAIALDNIELFKNWQKTNMDLMMAYDTTLEGWSRALDMRDEETEGHSRRVTEMTMRLAINIGVSDAELIHIRRGALLHDIGKMGIPDSILLKPGPLNDTENKIMKEHPQYAHDLLSSISYLKPALEIPYSHHEKWDGSGYPRGLKGEAIPLASRIFMIVDVWDALHSDRPYRKAWADEAIIDYMKEQSGKHFDPAVVEVFLQMLTDDENSIANA